MTRKIHTDVATAIKEKRNRKFKNTVVTYNPKHDTSDVRLHDTLIMIVSHGQGFVNHSLSGWNTVTTRARLNGVLSELGVDGHYTQRDFEPHYNGEAIDAKDTFTSEVA